jgi:EAL domain-containing protein (putative c-di-GMP-specific phosphodiesterase class I)
MELYDATDVELCHAYLEHYPEHHGPAQLVLCDRFPFRIGRSEKANLVIYSNQISKMHAVIQCSGEEYCVHDLGSTNGTYVNGCRVMASPLRHGDIVHFAHKEFRFSIVPVVDRQVNIEVDTEPVLKELPSSVIHGRQALQEVLLHQKVRVLFQPIIDLQSKGIVGYEALGRGTHEDLSQNPAHLFRLAEQCGLAIQLSRLFRHIALREVNAISGPMWLFFNVHPSEMENQDFVESLIEERAHGPGAHRAVMEVHENCVYDVPAMRRLRDRLHEMGISLAYDDFGAGQARLAELADAPPDFLKIDMKLIRGIDGAPVRQDLVGSLTEVCARLGIRVLAEGIETDEEAACCRRLGCHWAQGFLFGTPTSLVTPPVAPSGPTKRIDLGPLRAKMQKRQL